MDDNKKFWQMTAGIYQYFTRSGKKSEGAYSQMENEIQTKLSSSMKVLELAAGPGMLSGKIAQSCKELVVSDFSDEMLSQARKKVTNTNVSFNVIDATDIPYKEETFDAVVIANALHIMPDPVKALSEIKRVLKNDCILIAPTFTRESSKRTSKEALFELFGFKTYSRWTHTDFEEFIKANGFTPVYSKIITGYHFPISFIVAKKNE